VVVAVVGLSAAQDASAYELEGDRWPGRTITYFDAGPDRAAVRKAVAAWNASGIRVRFKAVPRRRARVLVVKRGAGCQGFAQIGYERHVRVARLRLGSCPRAHVAAAVAAHEFGHILGLGHTYEQCALMQPVVQQGCEDTEHEAHCRLIEPDDLRGALKLYGGRTKPLPPRLCPYFAAPPAPVDLEIVGVDGGADGMLYAGFRVPRPQQLIEGPSGTPQVTVSVYATQDACPSAMPAGEPIARERVFTGAEASITLGRRRDPRWQEGRYCFTAWARDALGRAAPGPAVAQVEFRFERPEAAFSYFAAPAGETSSFFDESYPGERGPVTYSWDFGDPASDTDVSSERSPNHTYPAAGTYTVRLTVRDADGVESTATRTVTVDPAPER
jgi:hypothetical protein